MKPALLLGLFLWLAVSPAAANPEAARPALLVLGTPHFDNPGRDLVNTNVADVTTPERQREIEALVEALAAFRPTHVAVEWPASEQDRLDRRYAEYRAGRYALTADERDQIGLRLAARLGLTRVDAVDWNEMPPGRTEDYDFIAYAGAHGLGDAFQASREAAQQAADTEARLMACTPVMAWLRRANDPASRRESHRAYYRIASLGGQESNPGAAWVGTWYARNLRILLNLSRLAASPDDRVLAIYGAGHGYLLDQQARESGLFAVADTLAFLPPSPAGERTHCGD